MKFEVDDNDPKYRELFIADPVINQRTGAISSGRMRAKESYNMAMDLCEVIKQLVDDEDLQDHAQELAHLIEAEWAELPDAHGR